MKKISKIETARLFARLAHKGQVRKYTGDPYFIHPTCVSDMVDMIGGDENMICAALLHDVIEDTDYTREEIEKEFGEDVAALVVELTEVVVEGNRKTRKQSECDRLAKVSNRAKTIKLADLIDNTSSIVEHDPEFAKVYLQEKRDLLLVLNDGNSILMHKAKLALERGFKKLLALDQEEPKQ